MVRSRMGERTVVLPRKETAVGVVHRDDERHRADLLYRHKGGAQPLGERLGGEERPSNRADRDTDPRGRQGVFRRRHEGEVEVLLGHQGADDRRGQR